MSRGRRVYGEQVSNEALEGKPEKLALLDKLILNLLADEIEGPPERVFTDDFDDWPYEIFLL